MQLFCKVVQRIKISRFCREFSIEAKPKNVKKAAKSIAIDIIGSGGPGEPAIVCLSTSNKVNYLFNCGEDTQRLLNDQKWNISQIKHIFLTQNRWKCIGGLSCLSKIINQSQGCLPMFHGPSQLYKSIKRILCLSILSEVEFQPVDCNRELFFEDHNLRIDFLSIGTKGDQSEVLAFVGKVKDTKDDSAKFMSTLTIPLKSSNFKFPIFFAVLDLPSVEHLRSFIESPQFKELQVPFQMIVHFSPQSVTQLREYKKLTSSLDAKKHFYLNESNEYDRWKMFAKLVAKAVVNNMFFISNL